MRHRKREVEGRSGREKEREAHGKGDKKGVSEILVELDLKFHALQLCIK